MAIDIENPGADTLALMFALANVLKDSYLPEVTTGAANSFVIQAGQHQGTGGDAGKGGNYRINAGSSAGAIGGNLIFNSGTGGFAGGYGDIILDAGGPGTKGHIRLHGNVACPQYDPYSYTASDTLPSEALQYRIVTAASASAVSLTLPTGTNLDAVFADLENGLELAFDWSVINLGSASGIVTILPNTGHTIVGSASIAVGASAQFRSRKTNINTFITYRIG